MPNIPIFHRWPFSRWTKMHKNNQHNDESDMHYSFFLGPALVFFMLGCKPFLFLKHCYRISVLWLRDQLYTVTRKEKKHSNFFFRDVESSPCTPLWLGKIIKSQSFLRTKVEHWLKPGLAWLNNVRSETK